MAVGPSVYSVALTPDAPAELISPGGDVSVSIAPNTVDGASMLTYSALEIADIPTLPPGFTATGKAFNLSTDSPLLKPITITVGLSAAESALSGNEEENISIQHHHGGVWETLPTTVDFTVIGLREPVVFGSDSFKP